VTLDWEPAAVAGLARALIATGFATAGPYNHLALNPALCPYLRRALAADQRVGLEARWQQARLHRPDARQPRSWVLTAHPAPANLRQSNLDAQVGLEFLFVSPPPRAAASSPSNLGQTDGKLCWISRSQGRKSNGAEQRPFVSLIRE
jgi:hypothetical protein